jgi:RimJ/RimL family protein N-acetyltransferase
MLANCHTEQGAPRQLPSYRLVPAPGFRRGPLLVKGMCAISVVRLLFRTGLSPAFAEPILRLMHLETERLIIRSWRETDVDRYAAIVGKASVMKYIGDGRPEDHESARRFIAAAIEDERQGKPIFWAVESRATNELLGCCGFGICGGEVDMGWRYDDRHWGMGYGSEAARAVLAYAVKAFGFTRIISRADPANLGSIAIMKKLGFAFESEARNGTIHRAIYAYVARAEAS